MGNLLFVTTSGVNKIKNGFAITRLEYYSKLFDNIYVLCLGKSYAQRHGNITYLCGAILNLLRYIKFIKNKNIVAVKIDNFFIGGLLGLFASRLLKKPLVLRCGASWEYVIDSPIKLIKLLMVKITKPIVIKNCVKVIYNSKALVQRQYPHNWTVVYNGVDTKKFRPLKYKRQHKKLRILFVGRICREKGLDYLFSAIKQIRESVHLGIIGNGPKLKYYQTKYPFAKFYGSIAHTKLPRYINQYDALILPTLLDDSFPNVLLEAMACGKPVIATKVGGIPELVKNNYNGLLIPPRNSEAIKKAILKLNNKKLTNRLSKNARKTILKNFKLEPQMKLLCSALFGDLPNINIDI